MNIVRNLFEKYFLLTVFLLLAVLEIACFGNSVIGDGFYPDDWWFFNRMHFLPDDFLAIANTFLLDPRAIIRPICAPIIFAPIYFLARENPLPFHLVNSIFEMLSAWYVFRFVLEISRHRALALITSIIFLLSPSHDFTHHLALTVWSFSMMLFAYSLWQFSLGVREKRKWPVAMAGFTYLISIFSYEGALPLFVVYPLIALMLQNSHESWRQKIITSLKWSILFVLPPVLMIAYRMFFLPLLHVLASVYPVQKDIGHFLNVIFSGFKVTVLPPAFGIYLSLANDCLQDKLPLWQWITLVASTLLILSATYAVCRTTQKSENNISWLLIIGIVGLAFSYTIFGICPIPDYTPTITDLMNRVNFDGSIFSSLILAVIIVWCTGRFKQASLITSIVVSALIVLFFLSNWALCRPWIVSWKAQRMICAFIKSKANEIQSGDSIVIANWPRYVRWAPAVDGWEFESMLHVLLNDASIKGTAMTDRITITPKALVEDICGTLMGRFPFKRMFIYIPSQSIWFRVHSKEDFLKACKQYDIGLGWCKFANEEIKEVH